MNTVPQNVLIVDLSHLFWTKALGMRAALEARNAVMNTIRGLARQYDRVAIACDATGPSFRAAIFPKYKANRKAERTPERWAALASLQEHCDAAGYHMFVSPEHPEHPGHYYESDDVIAALVAWCVRSGVPADILSGDSDLAQLVDDEAQIIFLRDHRGALTRMGVAAVESWQGVPPARILEVKALAGDGDGYKPFPGLADEGAKKLLGAAPAFTALSVVTAALASGITKNKNGSVNNTSRILNEGGIKAVEFGYTMARLRADAPIAADSLSVIREARAMPEIGDDFLPPGEVDDDAAERAAIEAEATDSSSVSRASGKPAANVPQPTALARLDDHMLMSPAEMRNRYFELRAFIKRCMVQGTDYGTIQGCGPKPVLLQPGAEKLADLYGYSCSFECVEKIQKWDDAAPFFFFQYKCIVRRKSDNTKVAEYEGSANSREIKWVARWVFEREVPPHLDIARLKRREIRSKKDPEKTYWQYQVPNEDICSQVNTILKIAQKRAMVSAVRLATRTAGIFEVDEDVPREAYGDVRPQKQWDDAS